MWGQELPDKEKRVKKISKKINQGAKWNKKMGGRSFIITCGLCSFEDTQVGRLYCKSGTAQETDRYSLPGEWSKQEGTAQQCAHQGTQAPPGQVVTCFQVWPSKIFDPVIN